MLLSIPQSKNSKFLFKKLMIAFMHQNQLKQFNRQNNGNEAPTSGTKQAQQIKELKNQQPAEQQIRSQYNKQQKQLQQQL